ncbi:hypothetical protein HDU98_009517 [Podochytrium sp. JEL0797]|nr:hypothetical protein HDU98_009517 [Podochytrium sp. JEL0797]
MSVIITHKGKKLDIPFSSTDKLSDLVNRCSEATGVPTDRIKLLASGEDPVADFFGKVGSKISNWFGGSESPKPQQPQQQQQQGGFSRPDLVQRVNMFGEQDFKGSYVMMKDMNASLIHYGIKNGSKIMMMGDTAPPPRAPTSLPSTPSEQLHTTTPEDLALTTLQTATATLTTTILPLIDQYIALADQHTSSDSLDASRSKHLRQEHARMSELVLQVLLKVDAVKAPEGDEVVRMRRKEAVRECNRLLEKVDAVKDGVRVFEEDMKSKM